MEDSPVSRCKFFCSYYKSKNQLTEKIYIKPVFSVCPLLMHCIWEQLYLFLVYFGTYCLFLNSCILFWIVIFASLLKSVGFASFDFSSIRIRKFNWFHAISVAVSVNGMLFVLISLKIEQNLIDFTFTLPF